MKRLLVWTLLLFTGWCASVVYARVITETGFTNVRVIIYQDSTDGRTRVMITGNVLNPVTTSRPIQFELTPQLTANQLTTASNAYNFALGVIGVQESVPTPTPTPTSTTATKTPTPTITSTP